MTRISSSKKTTPLLGFDAWGNTLTLRINDFSRGINYGDGLFETIRVYKGEPLFLEHHLARLSNGLILLSLPIDINVIAQEIIAYCRTLPWLHARLRLNVFRHGEGTYAPLENNAIFTLQAFILTGGYQFSQPQTWMISEKSIKTWSPISHLKTSNALPYVLASIEAKNSSVDVAVLTNGGGKVIETTSSNIFIWDDNSIITPPLRDGPIEGVLRKVIFEQIGPRNGFPVEARNLTISQMIEAREIFCTNVIAGIVPLYTRTTRNPVAFELHQTLLAIVGDR